MSALTAWLRDTVSEITESDSLNSAHRERKLTHTNVWPSVSSSSQRRIPRRSGVLPHR